MPKLTQRLIDSIQATEVRQTFWDDALRGFGVRVSPPSQMNPRNQKPMPATAKPGSTLVTSAAAATNARSASRLVKLPTARVPRRSTLALHLLREVACIARPP